jgi:cardiolipin synthase A/B
MTGKPDKKVPFYAAHAYYRRLLDAGVSVYQYTAGFLHAKTVTVDDDLAIIGTCNWDIRSLILHDEVVSVFHDRRIAKESAEQYGRDIDACVQVTVADLGALSGRQSTRNSLCRLLSRLL